MQQLGHLEAIYRFDIDVMIERGGSALPCIAPISGPERYPSGVKTRPVAMFEAADQHPRDAMVAKAG
jgi:hypothetical protein